MSQRFKGIKNFEHGKPPITGVLIVNLGTPEEPSASAVRRYLAEFLSDNRVVEIPRLIWKIILHGIVLRIRPKKSAQAYQRVWSEHGSPLMAGSSALTRHIAKRLTSRFGGHVHTMLAMRYGEPSIREGLRQLQDNGANRIVILPLYPQYSGATTGTVADEVFRQLMGWRWVPELHLLGPYHDDPGYIRAIAASIEEHWKTHGRGDKLMISFHGMPKATLIAGDPYFCHAHKTARLIAEQLKLSESEWEMAFQSRFGAAEWLKPYAAERWSELPAEGVKNLTVVCPGFSIDCLETIDEIAHEGRQDFLAAGGESFEYVPCLNDSNAHVELLTDRLEQQLGLWLNPDTMDEGMCRKQQEQSRQMALASGATS